MGCGLIGIAGTTVRGVSGWVFWWWRCWVRVWPATFLWQRQHAGAPVRTYTVVAAMSGGGRVVLNGSGYVVARRAATVSSKVTGKVVEVRIEEGQQVQKGEVLARLDDTNVQAALRLAEAGTDGRASGPGGNAGVVRPSGARIAPD
jgi:multidrug efflux pump subunit AcrA (membrane-fusion protein)